MQGLAKAQTLVDQGDRGQSPQGELPSPALPAGLRLRQYQDHGAVSPFGKSLLDLCCSAIYQNLNGRVAGDTTGRLTFPPPQGGRLVDYFVATYALSGFQPTSTVQVCQPESDHRPLHLRLHLPHTSTPASLPPPQHLQRFRHCSERVSEYFANLATHLSSTGAEGDPATWLQTCIATSAAATHGVQKPTGAAHAPKPLFDA